MFKIVHLNAKRIDERIIIITAVYLTGIFHWYLFINYQSPTFTFGDWHFGYQIFDVFKQALQTGQIPYHATLFASDTMEQTMYGSSRFLATPWIIMPPLMFFLLFLSVPAVITAQFILYFTISFIGILKWARKLNLSLCSTSFLLIVFSFNGALVSKAGGGQCIWGYMLIPWFLWFLYKFIENKNPTRSESISTMLKYSFLLFFVLLSGDMHNFYQFFLVGLCVLLFYPKRLLNFAASTLAGVILSAWYFVPNLLFSHYVTSVLPPEGHWRRSGIMGFGYGNGDSGMTISDNILVKVVSNDVTRIIAHIWESLTYSFNASYVNVWETNLYVSCLGVLLITGGLIMVIRKPYRRKRPLQKKLENDPRVQKRLFTVGLLFIGMGLVLNEFLLTSLFSEDGNVASSSRLKIWIFDCFCIGIGSLLVLSESCRNFSANSYYSVFRICVQIIKDLTNTKVLKNNITKYRFLLGAGIIFIFASGSFNQLVVKTLQELYPFNPIDAIPSRLMLYPFSMVLIIASIGYDHIFNIFPYKIRTWIKWGVLIGLLLLLLLHSYGWWLAQSQILHFDQFQGEFKTKIYDVSNDILYKRVVNFSYLSSLILVSGGIWISFRLKRYEYRLART